MDERHPSACWEICPRPCLSGLRTNSFAQGTVVSLHSTESCRLFYLLFLKVCLTPPPLLFNPWRPLTAGVHSDGLYLHSSSEMNVWMFLWASCQGQRALGCAAERWCVWVRVLKAGMLESVFLFSCIILPLSDESGTEAWSRLQHP